MPSNNNSNQTLVPQAKEMLNRMKYEIASEVGVNLSQGYNGNLASKDAGRIGGQMVKRMISYAESHFSGSGNPSGMA